MRYKLKYNMLNFHYQGMSDDHVKHKKKTYVCQKFKVLYWKHEKCGNASPPTLEHMQDSNYSTEDPGVSVSPCMSYKLASGQWIIIKSFSRIFLLFYVRMAVRENGALIRWMDI